MFCTIEREIDVDLAFQDHIILDMEGKIFALIARRMTPYTVENEYVNISVQKGAIPRCLGDTSVISQLIKVTKWILTVVSDKRIWYSSTQAHRDIISAMRYTREDWHNHIN